MDPQGGGGGCRARWARPYNRRPHPGLRPRSPSPIRFQFQINGKFPPNPSAPSPPGRATAPGRPWRPRPPARGGAPRADAALLPGSSWTGRRTPPTSTPRAREARQTWSCSSSRLLACPRRSSTAPCSPTTTRPGPASTERTRRDASSSRSPRRERLATPTSLSAAPSPEFPEEEFGHALSEAAPTGILFDPEAKGGDGFFVAQMKSTPPVAAALLFSSDANGWSVAEVPAEDRWHGFRASSVVSHDRGDSAGFAFVDLRRRGLLLLHPRRLAAARFIELPVPEGGGGGEAIDEGQATVDYSDGRLVFVVFKEVDEATLVRFWCLSDEERRWWSHSHISSDEVFGRDSGVWPLRLRVPPVLGPLDPNLPTRIIFGDGTFSAFFLDVTPDEMGMLRVSPRALDSVVCHIPPPPKSTWTEAMTSAVEEGKHAGMVLFGALQKGRPYADSLPAVVQLVGTTLSLPHTAVALTAARAIQTVNNYFTISEYASTWFWKNRPGAPGVFTKVVSSLEEAEQALEEWIGFEKPRNMMVDPAAEGLSQEDWNEIRDYLKAKGAASLVQHHEWEMVGRPPN